MKKWSEKKKPRVLLVDDIGQFLDPVALKLESAGFEVVKMDFTGKHPSTDPKTLRVSNLDEVIEYAKNPSSQVDAVLTDLSMNSIPYAGDIVRGLQEGIKKIPILVHTGELDSQYDASLRKTDKKKIYKGMFERSDWDGILACLNKALNKAVGIPGS